MEKLAILGGEKIRKKPFMASAVIGDEEKKRVMGVLESGKLSGFTAKPGDAFFGGNEINEFESLVKGYFNMGYAIAVNSATAGLHAALGACSIGPGDEVIVTPYTMSASATAVIMQNAIPVFADITEDTFCIDPVKIKQAVTPRTKAIVLVHLFGHPCDMDAIMEIARSADVKVIEDCAQAPGALYKGKPVGTIGDVGVFSLNQHKAITCGEGGFAVTNNEELALRVQLIRNHGEVVLDGMGVSEIDNMVGFNYRMTELEAAISIGQFKRLDYLNSHRIELAKYLTQQLRAFKGLILPEKHDYIKHVYFTYPIRFEEKEVGIPRDLFVKALKAEGIPFGAGYVRPIYLEPLYQKKIAYGKKGCPFTCAFYGRDRVYKEGDCPVCETMHNEKLMLTAVCRYPHTKEDIDDVVKAFKKIFENCEELAGARVA